MTSRNRSHAPLSPAARSLPVAPHPAIAVEDMLAISANRIMWLNTARAHGTENRRALHMLYTAVNPEHDVLSGLGRHATNSTPRKLCRHSDTTPSVLTRSLARFTRVSAPGAPSMKAAVQAHSAYAPLVSLSMLKPRQAIRDNTGERRHHRSVPSAPPLAAGAGIGYIASDIPRAACDRRYERSPAGPVRLA